MDHDPFILPGRCAAARRSSLERSLHGARRLSSSGGRLATPRGRRGYGEATCPAPLAETVRR
jgi:hypothetical protein